MKKFTTLGLAGLMLFGGTALFAGDNVEENMASTPELLKRWGSSQLATLLPTGGPKGKFASPAALPTPTARSGTSSISTKCGERSLSFPPMSKLKM